MRQSILQVTLDEALNKVDILKNEYKPIKIVPLLKK